MSPFHTVGVAWVMDNNDIPDLFASSAEILCKESQRAPNLNQHQ